MELYDELKAAGIPLENHESDLYFPDIDAARAILAKHPTEQKIAKPFRSLMDGSAWVEVPFAFLPFWEAKQKGGHNG